MTYPDVATAAFIERPNRFIARCLLEGREVTAHVKNTGRCRELLLPGATVYLQRHPPSAMDKGRKTAFSLIGVEKALPGGRLLSINMDSQAPNAVLAEWLDKTRRLPGLEGEIRRIRREATWGDCRFDFYLETEGGERGYVEVKGVTLEQDGVALFPDAPTLRGQRHVETLTALAEKGFYACVFFVVAMAGVTQFTPNYATHAAFGQALQTARAAGVELLAMDCAVTRDSITIGQELPIRL